MTQMKTSTEGESGTQLLCYYNLCVFLWLGDQGCPSQGILSSILGSNVNRKDLGCADPKRPRQKGSTRSFGAGVGATANKERGDGGGE